MSGGSLNYLCYKLEDASYKVEDREIADLLKDMAALMHDYEWYTSGDIGREGYIRTEEKFKKKWLGASRNERLKGYIDETFREMRNQIFQLLGESNEI